MHTKTSPSKTRGKTTFSSRMTRAVIPSNHRYQSHVIHQGSILPDISNEDSFKHNEPINVHWDVQLEENDKGKRN